MIKAVQILSVFLLLTLSFCKTRMNTKSDKVNDEQFTSTHNSRNSLDWEGVYRGIMPCADCEGIQTELVLSKDFNYRMTRKYLGRNGEVFMDKGTFEWNKDGNSIMLGKGNQRDEEKYMVGENTLYRLDSNGRRITGALASKYALAKETNVAGIEERYWRLIELNGKKISSDNKGTRQPHFVLKTGKRISGNGGCNNFTGTYELIQGNKIQFSKIASTRMACLHVEYEDDFLRIFEKADHYSIAGDSLTLQDLSNADLAKFEFDYFK